MGVSKAKMSQKAIKNVWASKLYSSTLKDTAVTNPEVLYFTHTSLWIQQILSYLIPIRTCWSRYSQAHFSDEKTEVEPETSFVTLWSLGNWSLFFRPCCTACPILVPWPGIECIRPAVEAGFLTTGPPGKSQKPVSWAFTGVTFQPTPILE